MNERQKILVETFLKYVWMPILAIFCLFVGENLIKEYPSFKVEKGGVGLNDQPTTQRYFITLPQGDWYDTGIWVRPTEYIGLSSDSASKKQPFSVRIGDKEVDAILEKLDVFHVGVLVLEDASQYPANTRKQYGFVLIKNQAKVFVKLSSEATGYFTHLDMVIDEVNK